MTSKTVDKITKNTLDALSNASSFFNNSDSSEEDDTTEKEVQKICRRRSMLMPPSRKETLLTEAPAAPSRDKMQELDDLVSTFPIPPVGISVSLPPPAPPQQSPAPGNEKSTGLKQAVSGGLLSMKNLFAEKWGSKKA